MADATRVRRQREMVDFIYRKYPIVQDLAERFEQLATNPVFVHHLVGLRAFREGLDPIPNRDAHEDFLRAVGHEFAAAEALPKGNYLRLLFPGAIYENYVALHGLLAARLMDSPGALSRQQTVALYDTIDRLFRGGAAWPSITKVPTATAQYYRSLRKAHKPDTAALQLLDLTRAGATSDFDHACYMVHFSAIIFINMAITISHGRTRPTVEDSWETAEAYLKLFEADPLELPPLVREGRSGYEKA